MHDTAREIGRQFLSTYLVGRPVHILDIGAMDLNGSLRRWAPPDATYIGVDLQPGPGVDVVLSDPHALPFDSEQFDAVVSTSCLEHDTAFWLTFLEMARVVKSGGYIYLNAPSAGGYHRYPHDCWRFYPDAGLALEAWARKQGYFLELVESFIARRKVDGWNDCVMIFCKGSHRVNRLGLLVDHFPDSMNIRRHGVNGEIANFSSATEDMIRLHLVEQKAQSAPGSIAAWTQIYEPVSPAPAWRAVGVRTAPLSASAQPGGFASIEVTEIVGEGAHWIHAQIGAAGETSTQTAGTILLRDIVAAGLRLRFADSKARQVNWCIDFASMSVRSEPGIAVNVLSDRTVFAQFRFDSDRMQPPLSVGVQMLESGFQGNYEGDGTHGFVLDYFGMVGPDAKQAPADSLSVAGKPSAAPLRLGSYADVGGELVHESATRKSYQIELPRVVAGPSVAESRQVSAPNDYVVRLRDVVCCPGQLLLKNGCVLPDTFRRYDPRFDHSLLTRSANDRFQAKVPTAPARVVDEPCFYLDGEHCSHFGHFTLELLTRLWPLLEPELELGAVKFVTSCSLLDHLRAVMSAFGIAEDRILPLDAPTRFRELLISSQAYPLHQWITPNAFRVWDKIGAHFARPGTPRAIYASRRDSLHRKLLNEDEIQALFSGLGFTVVYPGEMSFADQVAHFRDAAVIAGPAGSNLNNWVYAWRTGVRIILAPDNFMTLRDTALINQKTKSDIVYVCGKAEEDRPGLFANWRIDPAMVKAVAEEMLAGGVGRPDSRAAAASAG